MTNTKQIFELLMKVKDSQTEMAIKISAINQHLKDMNDKIKYHDDDIKSLKTKVAMASGGLSALMLVLVILSYIGVV